MNNSKNCSGVQVGNPGSRVLLPGKAIAAIVTGLIVFYSCGPSREEMAFKEKAMMMADSVSLLAPGIATDTIDGVTRNFIRSAQIKFKVGDVFSVARKIEDLVKGEGGYVSISDVSSIEEWSRTYKCQADSLKEVRQYLTRGTITCRVPNRRLDTVMRKISDLAVFIDFCRLTSDDVKMKLYEGKLVKNRLKRFETRMTEDLARHSVKNGQILSAEDKLLEKQALADATEIESLELADKVNYSTVNLELYQLPRMSYETMASQPVICEWEPSFFTKLGDAFFQGFEMIKRFVLFLVGSWGLLLILVVLLYVARKGLLFYKQGNGVIEK